VHHRQVAAEGIGRQPVGPGGIAKPDPHLLGVRPRVPECLQPDRGAGATTGGVDHQVAVEHLLGGAAGPAQHPGPGDPATVGRCRQPDDVAGVEERHVGQGPHPGRDSALEQRPAGAEHDQSGGRLAEPVTVEVPAAVGQEVPDRHPGGDQVGREGREQLLQGLLAAGQQALDVAPVRHAPPSITRRTGVGTRVTAGL